MIPDFLSHKVLGLGKNKRHFRFQHNRLSLESLTFPAVTMVIKSGIDTRNVNTQK